MAPRRLGGRSKWRSEGYGAELGGEWLRARLAQLHVSVPNTRSVHARIRHWVVTQILGKSATSLGPTRDSLLKKSLCYAPRWGEIDFTVPLFDQFMKRWIPDLAILRGN